MSEWIGVDLDGTLAEEHGWVSVGYIGKPVLPMINRVRRWIQEGRDVRIFTARVAGPDAAEAEKYIEEWCAQNIGCVLPVTNTKDPEMIELWDDRAVKVVLNTGLTETEFRDFKCKTAE